MQRRGPGSKYERRIVNKNRCDAGICVARYLRVRIGRGQTCNRIIMLFKAGECRTGLVFRMKMVLSGMHLRRQLSGEKEQADQKNNRLSMCMSQCENVLCAA